MNATTRSPALPAGLILMAVAFSVALPLLGASAAPTATKVAEASQVQIPSPLGVETADDQANCSRSRKRLWVDGEGWIVRRITTCR